MPNTDITGFAFTGESRDLTGLQHHRARYYSSQLSTWVSLDPLETPNRYSYVDGNTVNATDPTGMLFWRGRYQNIYNPAYYGQSWNRRIFAHPWIEKGLESINGFWNTHLEFPSRLYINDRLYVDTIVFPKLSSNVLSPIYYDTPESGYIYEIEPTNSTQIIKGMDQLNQYISYLKSGVVSIGTVPRDHWNPIRHHLYIGSQYNWRSIEWQKGNNLFAGSEFISQLGSFLGRGPLRIDPNMLGAIGIPEAYWIMLPMNGLIIYEVESVIRQKVTEFTLEKIISVLLAGYINAGKRRQMPPVQDIPVPAFAYELAERLEPTTSCNTVVCGLSVDSVSNTAVFVGVAGAVSVAVIAALGGIAGGTSPLLENR